MEWCIGWAHHDIEAKWSLTNWPRVGAGATWRLTCNFTSPFHWTFTHTVTCLTYKHVLHDSLERRNATGALCARLLPPAQTREPPQRPDFIFKLARVELRPHTKDEALMLENQPVLHRDRLSSRRNVMIPTK